MQHKTLISTFQQTWILLEHFDNNAFSFALAKQKAKPLTYKEAKAAIAEFKKELMATGQASELFGVERDGWLEAILKSLDQTFGGTELFATVEKKATHLFYYIIKDHPFIDGNKRIASFLLLLFLDKNDLLYTNGNLHISPHTLASLALIVALSTPNEYERVVGFINEVLFG